MTAYDPRYPIGKFAPPADITAEDLRFAIQTLAEEPEQLRDAVRDLSDEQLDTPYRDGGWTVRQLVHHIADSHATALHRFKRALTEDWPEVHGYNEGAFATLHDVTAPVEWSLEEVEAVHARWGMLLTHMTDEQWDRGVRHSQRGKMGLELLTMLYAWHSQHHVAHVTHLRVKMGW